MVALSNGVSVGLLVEVRVEVVVAVSFKVGHVWLKVVVGGTIGRSPRCQVDKMSYD